MSSYLIGKKIVLKSNSEIRYTGTLHAIDTNTASISLVDVLSLGTEDRVQGNGFVPPVDTLYPYVVFRAADVTDIAVLDEPANEAPLPKDHAIVAQGVPSPQQPQPQSSQQQPFQPTPQPHPTSPQAPIIPPIAPSIATAHTTTLERVAHESQPTRQPVGPSVIPFEQLASGSSRGFAPNRGRPGHAQGNHGHGQAGARRGRGRAPGAFSAAAEQEDVSREFDFAGMNARFADLRTGEKVEDGAGGVAAVDADVEPVGEVKEEEKKPAYNKSSSFFDSVSSNIQNPGRGRGRPHYNSRNDGRQHQQQHEQRQLPPSDYPSSLPPRPTGQYPPRQQQPRYGRRDESALNDLTFGDGSDASARRGRGRGNGRRRASDVQPRVD